MTTMHLKTIFNLAAISLISATAAAYDFKVDSFYYSKLTENTVKLTVDNYDKDITLNSMTNFKLHFSSTMNKYSGTITIPSTVSDGTTQYDVVGIDDGVFYGCNDLVSIKIPDGVTHIGNGAFAYCEGLISLSVPNSVTHIGKGAFYHCAGIATINLPNNIDTIENHTFDSCTGIASITLPKHCITIGDGAFYGCKGLTTISIPDSVTSIGSYAFYICDELSFVNIPNGVTSIGGYAFDGCNLTTINIPNSIQYIGVFAFAHNYNLVYTTFDTNFVDHNIEFEFGAFSYCTSLKAVNISSIDGWCHINFGDFEANPLENAHYLYFNDEQISTLTIPSSVTSIGNRVFYSCSGLKSIYIPNSVSSIGNGAFAGCDNLISINIPNAVSSIGVNAFYGCTKLKEVNIGNLENYMHISRTKETENFGLSNYSLIENGLKITDLVIPEEMTTVGMYAFYGCTGLESITFHKDVTAISQNAFNGCTNVKKIICQGDTPSACGADALKGISRTECTLYVPETSGSNYQDTTPWSEFTNIVGGGTETPDSPKTCEAPTIIFDNETMQLIFSCTTEGAKCHYCINSDDIQGENIGESIQLTGIYKITAYASATDMYNSEKITAQLCWVSMEGESTDMFSAKKQRGIVVSTIGSTAVVNGTVSGSSISVYNAAGSLLKTISTADGQTTISDLSQGNVYILKIGDASVKVTL